MEGDEGGDAINGELLPSVQLLDPDAEMEPLPAGRKDPSCETTGGVLPFHFSLVGAFVIRWVRHGLGVGLPGGGCLVVTKVSGTRKILHQ